MACVVEDDVDTTEPFLCVFEGGSDVVFVCDVKLEDVEFFGGIFDLEGPRCQGQSWSLRDQFQRTNQ